MNDAVIDLELQRLRERVELQFRHIETLARALTSRSESRTVHLGPVLPKRTPRPLPAIPAVDAAWWPSVTRPAEPLVPTPGLGTLSLAGRDLVTTAVIVFGLKGEALANVVQRISARQRQTLDFKPVFLTDCPDFTAFRRFGFAFEYLPRPVYGAAPHVNPKGRAAERMKLLQQKWNFESVLDLTPHGSTSDHSPAVKNGKDGAAPAKAETMPKGLEAQIRLVRDSGLFDADWYRSRYPDAAGEDAIRHYLTKGAALGYDPSPLFNTAFYARQMLARGL